MCPGCTGETQNILCSAILALFIGHNLVLAEPIPDFRDAATFGERCGYIFEAPSMSFCPDW